MHFNGSFKIENTQDTSRFDLLQEDSQALKHAKKKKPIVLIIDEGASHVT